MNSNTAAARSAKPPTHPAAKPRILVPATRGVPGHILRHEIIACVGQIAGKRKKVVFSGEGAWTDNVTIRLPSINPLACYAPEDAAILRGFSAHEALHVRYTDWETSKQTQDRVTAKAQAKGATSKQARAIGRLYHTLDNILDDRVIENLGREEFPGTYGQLAALRRHGSTRRGERQAAGDEATDIVQAFLRALLEACDASNDWPSSSTSREAFARIVAAHPPLGKVTTGWEEQIRTLSERGSATPFAEELLHDLLAIAGKWPTEPDDQKAGEPAEKKAPQPTSECQKKPSKSGDNGAGHANKDQPPPATDHQDGKTGPQPAADDGAAPKPATEMAPEPKDETAPTTDLTPTDDSGPNNQDSGDESGDNDVTEDADDLTGDGEHETASDVEDTCEGEGKDKGDGDGEEHKQGGPDGESSTPGEDNGPGPEANASATAERPGSSKAISPPEGPSNGQGDAEPDGDKSSDSRQNAAQTGKSDPAVNSDGRESPSTAEAPDRGGLSNHQPDTAPRHHRHPEGPGSEPAPTPDKVTHNQQDYRAADASQDRDIPNGPAELPPESMGEEPTDFPVDPETDGEVYDTPEDPGEAAATGEGTVEGPEDPLAGIAVAAAAKPDVAPLDIAEVALRIAKITRDAEEHPSAAATLVRGIPLSEREAAYSHLENTIELDVRDAHRLNPAFRAATRPDTMRPPPPAAAKNPGQRGAMTRLLRPLLLAQRNDSVRTRCLDGSLDTSQVIGLALGEPDVFKTRTHAPRINTALLVLVDQSGSTHQIIGELMAVAEETGEVSLGMPELRIAVCTFTSVQSENDMERTLVTRVRNFEDPPGRAKASHLRWRSMPLAMGGTPTEVATLAAARMLESRREHRRILMTVTDGRPNNPDAALAVNLHLHTRGIEPCILEIGKHLTPHSQFEAAAVATGADDAARTLAGLLRGLLRRGRMG